MFIETASGQSSIVLTHVTTAGIAVAAIQWLKKTPLFPWITKEKSRLCRAIAIVAALVQVIGITYTWNPAVRMLGIHIPTLTEALALAISAIKTFVVQELVYQSTAKNGITELLRQILDAVKPGPNPQAQGPQPGGIIAGKAIGAVILLACSLTLSGCAVRNLPSGGTAPATKWEQVMAWNVALAQVNDGLADNVIALNQAGTVSKDSARAILTQQAFIAEADRRITANMKATATCASSAASTTSASALDAAAGNCAKGYAVAFQTDFALIADSLRSLTNSGALGLSQQESSAVSQVLSQLATLVRNIVAVLQEYGAVRGIVQ